MQTIVVDSDALIGLLVEQDALYDRVAQLFERFQDTNIHILMPATCIAETLTFLKRRGVQQGEIESVKSLLESNLFHIVDITREVVLLAFEFFSAKSSRKDTFFDAIVAAIARKYNADAIFSFDEWYKQQGFTLIEDWVK